MSITDPIADGLTIIRNAGRAGHEKADIPASGVMEEIVRILKKEGYISNYKKISDNKQGTLRTYLKFTSRNKPIIKNIKRISKPGLRIYVNRGKIPTVLQGMGMSILSTSKGVLTGKTAREKKVGGEVLCYVW
ncbi:MAG: 30S ribosomal protein S8 [Candidatus Omnitrophota bacterium]|nr:30S ribosomal protein S8 [Candidatus Omnitrophota bacterium]